MTSELFDEIEFPFNPKLRDRFKSGELAPVWMKQYPQLFTRRDIELIQPGKSFLFFEWLAAILLFQSTGYISCHKWCCVNHPAKLAKLRELAGDDFTEEVAMGELTGHPDLLVFAE